MRKLKLEIQMSVDGFIADKKGQMNWMIWPYTPKEWAWDKELQQYHIELTCSSDCILLSSHMAGGFHDHWEEVAQHPEDPRYAFAHPVTAMKKVVFSRKLKKSIWKHTEVANGNLHDEVTRLKNQPGKDIIVYGGASFVSSLIKARLIDEFHLLINPTAIGSGLPIFSTLQKKQPLDLIEARAFPCGVAVLHYEQKRMEA